MLRVPPTLALPQAPDQPTVFELAFEKGNPVAIDGVAMSPATILTKLNELGGERVKAGLKGRGKEPLLRLSGWPVRAPSRKAACRVPRIGRADAAGWHARGGRDVVTKQGKAKERAGKVVKSLGAVDEGVPASWLQCCRGANGPTAVARDRAAEPSKPRTGTARDASGPPSHPVPPRLPATPPRPQAPTVSAALTWWRAASWA